MTYSINRNGQSFGPYSRDEVQRYVSQGLISVNDLACIVGEQRWAPLHRLLAVPPPPPVPLSGSGRTVPSPPPPPFSTTGPVPPPPPPGPGSMPPEEPTFPENQAAEFWKALSRATPTVFVTPLIILANAIVFVLMLTHGVSFMDPTIQNLIDWGADYGPLTTNGEWWRSLTSTFVHIGIIHILMNMYVLYSIGKFTERLFGNFGFTVLYLLAGIGGSLASLCFHPHTVSAGASGAIFGLYGGLLAFLLLHRHTVPPETLKSLASSTGTFLLYNIVYGLMREGTDMAAHAGGLLAGFLVGLLLAQPLPRVTLGSRALRGILALVFGTAAMVVCAAQIPVTASESTRTDGGQSPSQQDGSGAVEGIRSTPPGELNGRVTDATGAGVPGATVTAFDKDGNARSVASGDDGSYRFDALPAGSYAVKFSARGFKESTAPAVSVEGNRSTAFNQEMQVGVDPQEGHAQESQYATAIRAVLQADEDLNDTMKELDRKMQKGPEQDPLMAANALTQLTAATSKYVVEAREIDMSSCPGDFAQAYMAHVAAWADTADALTLLSRHPAEADGWQQRAESLDENIRKTWNQVQALAARYGAQ